MTQITVIHAAANRACAGELRSALRAAGYAVWENEEGVTAGMAGYRRVSGYGILGSAAVVVVWSTAAGGEEQAGWEVATARQLLKPVVVVALDQTALPETLAGLPSVAAGSGCAELVERLRPHLPAPGGDDELGQLLGRLAQRTMRERRAGIEQAAEWVAQGRHEEVLRAHLAFIAEYDLTTAIQQAARQALAAPAGRRPATWFTADDARHMIGVRCKNGHVTWHDRRVICPASSRVKRALVVREGQERDQLWLPCAYCDEVVVKEVDCEGYKSR